MTATIYPLANACRPWRWGLIVGGYDPALVDAIKCHIPSRQRRWKRDVRQWWFRDEAMPALMPLCNHYCGSVRHLEANAALIMAVAGDHKQASKNFA